MTYRTIHDYGLIGDMNSCALVGSDGSIDWACFPRFDSPSVFAAILDPAGGRFAIAPVEEHESSHRYHEETNVLETTFTTASGSFAVIDFMPLSRPSQATAPHEIHRIVRGIRGRVAARAVFEPRLGYGEGETALRPGRHGVVARREGESLALITDVPLRVADGKAEAVFNVGAGDRTPFVAAWGRERTPAPRAMDSEAELARATRYWEAVSAKLEYGGAWRDWVLRSFLALHLLVYEPTGAIVAAPTTSLPEWIGGGRNWDYRYCWLRDAAWSMGVLFRLGDPHEGEAFARWVVGQCQLGLEHMQILYGIAPESVLEERELPHLAGYRGSPPVRVGNDAAFHRQLDVFGEVALSLSTYHKYHGDLTDEMWELVRRMADLAARAWHTEDRSIWEVRGPERHFVYSKVMCWVALDRACALVEAHGYEGPVEFWRAEAEKIKADVLANGWSEAKQSFVQHYGSESLDASALLIPFVGFLAPGDPRIASTVRAVQRELADGPFVRRYIPAETDDGLDCDEGAFYMLSFWLIGGLLTIGETEEAARLFDAVRETAGPLGLFAEMIDPETGAALGNYPQAFSHIGLIHTARNLSFALHSERTDPLIA
ncbi:MAG: glycoside hydrolase family 15 protein [Chloroflexota bacterium]|nr:glycoside hydrolase family 15 protein [Chloroflexota bacterium]